MKIRIAVIGRGGRIAPFVESIAEKIGEDIAASGSVLICGGKGGVMEAACRGCRKAGGFSVGILPSLSRKDANPFLDVALTTGLGFARNALVVSSADAVIAVNGMQGTLSEAALALNYGKPVVFVEGSGGISDLAKEKLAELGIKGSIYSSSPGEAVRKALEAAEGGLPPKTL